MDTLKYPTGDIRNLCIELINNKYSRANYFEYYLIVRNDNGYINIENFMNQIGIDLTTVKDWLASERGNEFLDCVSEESKIPKKLLMMTFINEINPEVSGMYIEQHILPIMIMDLNPVLSYRISKIVNNKLMNKKINSKK